MEYKVWLILAIAAGLAVALLPFYASYLRDALGVGVAHGYGRRGGEEYLVAGVVERVDSEGYIFVGGEKILVRGEWRGPEGVVGWEELLTVLKPGVAVEVYCVRSGKWGLMAEKIVVGGLVYTRG